MLVFVQTFAFGMTFELSAVKLRTSQFLEQGPDYPVSHATLNSILLESCLYLSFVDDGSIQRKSYGPVPGIVAIFKLSRKKDVFIPFSRFLGPRRVKLSTAGLL